MYINTYVYLYTYLLERETERGNYRGESFKIYIYWLGGADLGRPWV